MRNKRLIATRYSWPPELDGQPRLHIGRGQRPALASLRLLRKYQVIALGLAALLLLLGGAAAVAGNVIPPRPWQVFSSGGAASANGTISLNGSLGQPVSGPAAGGEVTLGAGYWYGIRRGAEGEPPRSYQIYLPLVVKVVVE